MDPVLAEPPDIVFKCIEASSFPEVVLPSGLLVVPTPAMLLVENNPPTLVVLALNTLLPGLTGPPNILPAAGLIPNDKESMELLVETGPPNDRVFGVPTLAVKTVLAEPNVAVLVGAEVAEPNPKPVLAGAEPNAALLAPKPVLTGPELAGLAPKLALAGPEPNVVPVLDVLPTVRLFWTPKRPP